MGPIPHSPFITLMGIDGSFRSFRTADVRLIEDYQTGDSEAVDRARVTLCDGTQVYAKGDTAGILRQIEALETP